MADQPVQSATEVATIVQLVAELLPTLLQFGIPAVEKAVQMIKSDPTIPASALKSTIEARLSAVATADQAILSETK